MYPLLYQPKLLAVLLRSCGQALEAKEIIVAVQARRTSGPGVYARCGPSTID